MPGFAVDPLTWVLVHGVVPGHKDGAVRQQLFDDPAGQESGQPPTRPTASREKATIAGGIARDERPQGAEEIGDGVLVDGEKGGAQQDEAAKGGGLGEGAAKGIGGVRAAGGRWACRWRSWRRTIRVLRA
jgi:hypothetical protein